MHGNDYGFENRYRMAGSLTTLSPLHVGDGDWLPMAERKARPDDPAAEAGAEYSSVCVDHEGRAYIPGSTIKGVLRAWAERHGLAADLIGRLFGTAESGGKATFGNAYLREAAPGEKGHRWWNGKRGTCVAPGVSIDPRSRTAKEHLLFYAEFVPEGAVFDFSIEGGDWSEDERDLMLALLGQAFAADADSVRIGAGTADGWGSARLRLTDCEVLERADVVHWIDSGCAGRPKPRSVKAQLAEMQSAAVAKFPARSSQAVLELKIALRFEGAFLVNDPSQARRRTEREEGVSHATVRKRDDRYFLPASAVRGSLRSQARRIWQTLAHGGTADLDRLQPVQQQAKRTKEQNKLAPFVRLFGAPGWRSPMEVTDFFLEGQAKPRMQEFVAVDRFTGGAADERKFNAWGLYRPVFTGTIRVNLTSLENSGTGGWAMLLLLFLLRDLAEGDVRFGFGSSKGYGECRAEIAVSVQGEAPADYGGSEFESMVWAALAGSAAGGTLEKWGRGLAEATAA